MKSPIPSNVKYEPSYASLKSSPFSDSWTALLYWMQQEHGARREAVRAPDRRAKLAIAKENAEACNC
ncbi:MAG: hypothetical protein LW870_08670, partial [Pirellula sp.]|nr:hypothetical protein [Pirellula sp.]